MRTFEYSGELEIEVDRKGWDAFKGALAGVLPSCRPVYEVRFTGRCTMLAHVEQVDPRTFDLYSPRCRFGMSHFATSFEVCVRGAS